MIESKQITALSLCKASIIHGRSVNSFPYIGIQRALTPYHCGVWEVGTDSVRAVNLTLTLNRTQTISVTTSRAHPHSHFPLKPFPTVS